MITKIIITLILSIVLLGFGFFCYTLINDIISIKKEKKNG